MLLKNGAHLKLRFYIVHVLSEMGLISRIFGLITDLRRWPRPRTNCGLIFRQWPTGDDHFSTSQLGASPPAAIPRRPGFAQGRIRLPVLETERCFDRVCVLRGMRSRDLSQVLSRGRLFFARICRSER